jgi:energy-coupling factor transporter ATP-binding protein EcfA2
MELLGAVLSEYKSVRHAEIPLGGLTVLCGPNGAGKTNLIEALGAYDPLAESDLTRRGAPKQAGQPRVALVTRFDVTANGNGSDSSLLLEMIAAPWAAKMPAREISDGIGAYCGSCWWLGGGDLYADASRASLPAAFEVIRQTLLASVPLPLRDLAGRFLDLLLDKPVLFVQEDFAVDLSCDRNTEKGRELWTLSEKLMELPDGVFAHILGPFRDWTARWPPLTLLTRGPGAEGTGVPAGFTWIADRLGGIQAISVDPDTIEEHLDDALERAHDVIQHQPYDMPYDWPEEADGLCEVCLSPTHGGRVDPQIYDGDPLTFQGSPKWLEEHDGWVRVRPTLRDTLAVIEGQAQERMPTFAQQHGRVRLEIRPIAEWDASPARCRIMFYIDPGDPLSSIADWEGPIGIKGVDYGFDRAILPVPIADLGAGVRRWVALAVRQAADACASGELAIMRPLRGSHDDDWHPVMVSAEEPVQPRILVVDEPEQHLHPAAQESIAAWALEQATQHNAMLVATHSPAFFALPPRLATICQVFRVGHETRVQLLPGIHDSDVVARSRQLGAEVGLGRQALAQLTRAIVLVEGEWDRQLLNAFYRGELQEQRILVVPLQGSDELGGMTDAALIPTLGVPVVALLDEVSASSWQELAQLTGPISKAERALRDLATALAGWMAIVRYQDPDVICALPEPAVLLAYPQSGFPGWAELLDRWRSAIASGVTSYSFKRWSLEALNLPTRKDRMPGTFFRNVLLHVSNSMKPTEHFADAVNQVLRLVDS